MLASEGLLGLPIFPVFEGGFTPWDDLLSSFQPHQSPDPVNSNNSSSDEPSNQLRPVSTSAVDERKQRRMISNRLSARRSRMRKQEHLEGLRNQVNRLRIENREIANRLGFVTHRNHLLRRDNDRLRSESVSLRQRLSDIRRILLLRQLQRQHHQHHLVPVAMHDSLSFLDGINERIPSLIA